MPVRRSRVDRTSKQPSRQARSQPCVYCVIRPETFHNGSLMVAIPTKIIMDSYVSFAIHKLRRSEPMLSEQR